MPTSTSRSARRRGAPGDGVAARRPISWPWLVAAVFGFFILALLARVPFLKVPFSVDEAFYSLVARQWLAGRRLYADLDFVRPPLMVLPYALARAVSAFRGADSAGVLTVRVLAAIWSAATVALTAGYLLRRVRPIAAIAASLMAVYWSASILLQNEANAETWLLLGWTAAGLLLLEVSGATMTTRKACLLAGAAGAFAGFGMAFKQPGFLMSALPLAAIAAYPSPLSRRVREGMCYLGGMAAVFVASVVWMSIQNDGLASVYRPWFGMSGYIQAGQSLPIAVLLTRFSEQIAIPFIYPALLVVVAGLIALAFTARMRTPETARLRYAVVWLAISVVATSLSRYYFIHYYLLTLPALVLLLASTIDVGLARRSRAGSLAVAALAVAVLACAVVGYRAELAESERQAKLRTIGPTLAKRADRLVPSGSTMLVWGTHQSTGAYSALPPATDVLFFAYNGAVFGPPGGTTFLGRHFSSAGDRVLERWESGDVPDVILLSTHLAEDPQDPRISAALEELLANGYELRDSGQYRGRPWEIWVRQGVSL